MNTNTNEMNMKELNLDEMEQINGGCIVCLCKEMVKHAKNVINHFLED